MKSWLSGVNFRDSRKVHILSINRKNVITATLTEKLE